MFVKEKTRDLRTMIVRPLILLISLSSLLIFLLINVVLVYALDIGMLNSLDTAAASFNQLHRYNKSASLESNAELFLRSYSQAEPGRYTMHIIISGRDGKILKASGGFSENTAIQIIEASSQKNAENDEMLREAERIRLKSGQRYYAIKSPADREGRNVYLVAESDIFRNVLISTNQGLIAILLFVTLFLLIITFGVATHLSGPVKKLSLHAKQVGDGILVPIEINSACNELRDLEKSINEMVKHLSAYKSAQSMSLQNLSHELRTPLMSIQGYAEGMKMGYFEAESEAADIIIDESKKLSAIVDQILILSRLDTFNQPVDILPMSLNGFVKSQIKALNGYAFKQGITLELREEGEDILIMADSNLLYNIFVNILSNAIRHGNSHVAIKVYEYGEKGGFTVSDDGEGLSEEALLHLFDRFYKGSRGNFGLGLSIAKLAAEYMEGSIEAENGSTGAVFTVCLPLA